MQELRKKENHPHIHGAQAVFINAAAGRNSFRPGRGFI
jgi:hypothetical protein